MRADRAFRRARRASRACAAAARSPSSRLRAGSTFVIRLVLEVAPDRGRSQKFLDSFGFVESLVEPESDLRCKFQVNVPRDLAAKEALVALERGEHLVAVAPAQRH